MTRIWDFSGKQADGAARGAGPNGPQGLPPGAMPGAGGGPGYGGPGYGGYGPGTGMGGPAGALGPGPGPGPDDGWDPELEEEFGPVEHYVTRPVRPITQLATRVGLWAAVVLGCVGGIFSLVRPSPQAAAEEAVEEDQGMGVPAPVSGTAEIIVEEWLTVTDEDADVVQQYFVERPDFDLVDTEAIQVYRVHTVAGQRLDEGYWTVTVAVDLVETGPGNEQLPPSTWYVEVGIVGDVAKGLKAITTPAVVPAPPGVPESWRTSAPNPEAPESDDRVAAAVEGFLNALLAGKSDPDRYLAPGETMEAADPVPFEEVELMEMSVVELETGEIQIWALARVTTPGGSTHMVGYELKAKQRIDRWEILSVWGAPAVRPVEVEEDSEGDPIPPTPTGSTTTLPGSDTSDTTGGEDDPLAEYPEHTDENTEDAGETGETDGTGTGDTDETGDTGGSTTTIDPDEPPLTVPGE